MEIKNFRSERKGDRARVAATVIWEDCNRPTQEVYFETKKEFADDLTCNPHAFLVACAIPAMHYGEKRVFVDAEICPELRTGLITVMSWLRFWYYKTDYELPRIEAKIRSNISTMRTQKRAGFFFSGGIDSFTALYNNRLNFPSEHLGSIKDGILAYGLELDDTKVFDYVVNLLSDAARAAGITLIPIYTNIYLNYRNEDEKNHFDFWLNEFEGAALSAIAHVFTNRLAVVSIASSYDIPNIHPHASHPLLDPLYSSSDLRIRHVDVELSRFDKTKLVVNWDVALQHLRVCNQYERYLPNMINCGRCEKCVRTMISLLALGMLDKTSVFPNKDVSAELLQSVVTLNKTSFFFYEELLTPLINKGRYDLVRIIEQKIVEYHRRQKLDRLKGKIKQFDHKYFHNGIVRFRNYFSHKKKTRC